jgi:hypothetical protein
MAATSYHGNRSMNSDRALDSIKVRQRAWALRAGLKTDARGYCACDDDNVFGGLSAGARTDFEQGDGDELGGKIRALHSSSALACNWFDYWRGRDLSPLTRAFGVAAPFTSLSLEQKLHTGLGGIGPNLDVLLTCADGTLFGIESKFTEPYKSSRLKTFLKRRYLIEGRHLWTERGLPGCQTVADALGRGKHEFAVLDVAQLLKHMLGLAHTAKPWKLCCLWFDVPGTTSTRHHEELDRFTGKIGDDALRFVALTYQELLPRMVGHIGLEHAEYVSYLRDRYINPVA